MFSRGKSARLRCQPCSSCRHSLLPQVSIWKPGSSHLLYSSCLLSAGIWVGPGFPPLELPPSHPFSTGKGSVTYVPSCKQKIAHNGDCHGCLWSSLALTNCEKRILCSGQETESVFCPSALSGYCFRAFHPSFPSQKNSGSDMSNSWLDFLASTRICCRAPP